MKLRPETLDFFARAPLKLQDRAVIGKSPDEVFAALADVSTWTKWFPLMTRCEWVTKETACVGAERVVSLTLLGTYRERFLAWEPGKRFAFTMTESSSPLARAIAEDMILSPVDGGSATAIDWTMAAQPTIVGRLGRPILMATMRRVFREGGLRLGRLLGA
ncbi:MAG TPA: SRPBCC family protein [Polyangiaceae bacterium]|jgi:hypothetical protein|nr:SRPBCC family protein [Polyangiaceae bacterium]